MNTLNTIFALIFARGFVTGYLHFFQKYIFMWDRKKRTTLFRLSFFDIDQNSDQTISDKSESYFDFDSYWK